MKFLSYPELFIYHTGVEDGYRFTGLYFFAGIIMNLLWCYRSVTSHFVYSHFVNCFYSQFVYYISEGTPHFRQQAHQQGSTSQISLSLIWIYTGSFACLLCFPYRINNIGLYHHCNLE